MQYWKRLGHRPRAYRIVDVVSAPSCYLIFRLSSSLSAVRPPGAARHSAFAFLRPSIALSRVQSANQPSLGDYKADSSARMPACVARRRPVITRGWRGLAGQISDGALRCHPPAADNVPLSRARDSKRRYTPTTPPRFSRRVARLPTRLPQISAMIRFATAAAASDCSGGCLVPMHTSRFRSCTTQATRMQGHSDIRPNSTCCVTTRQARRVVRVVT